MMNRSLKTGLALILVLAISLGATPLTFAQGTPRIVRVGYMNHPGFAETDAGGTVQGYGAEYLMDICEHTGWELQYVLAPWEKQMELLQKGEIDLVMMAQQSAARAENFIFSRQEMGIVQCLLFTTEAHPELVYDDPTTFDQKRIGVMRGNYNSTLLAQYAEMEHFGYKLFEYDYQSDLEDALLKGEVDIIACEQMVHTENLRLLAHCGSDPFYFMMAKGNEALMTELNLAMSEVFTYNVNYQRELYQKYYGDTVTNSKPFFTKKEKAYLSGLDKLTIALIPNSQPHSYFDEAGEAQGITKEILDAVSELCGIPFEYVMLPLDVVPADYVEEHPDVLVAGVLAANPVFHEKGLLVSKPFNQTYAAVAIRTRRNEHIDITRDRLAVGTTRSFQAMQRYIEKTYPNLDVKAPYLDCEEGLSALLREEIDLFTYNLNTLIPLASTPRFSGISIIGNEFLPIDLAIVANPAGGHETLMRILNKCISVIPSAMIDEIEKKHFQNNIYDWKPQDNFYGLGSSLLTATLISVTALLFVLLGRYNDKKNQRLLKEKNEELARALQTADIASRVKSDFLSHVSHDIRTPMNAIIGMTTLARHEVGNNEKLAGYLDGIRTSSRLLLGILNDILDDSSLEKGKLKISNERFHLRTELRALVSLFAVEMPHKQIQFAFHDEALTHLALIGDPIRLRQILMNLLSNAIRLCDQGGTVSLVCKEETADDKTVTFSFAVSNTGMPLEKEFLSDIFNSNDEDTASLDKNLDGQGLGLTIVKHLVELMHGSISIDSRPDAGTSFTVQLPFTLDAFGDSAPAIDKWTPESIEAAYDLRGKRILIADDDVFDRETLEGILELVQAECVLVENGEKALRAFAAAPSYTYDAILMDMQMPILDGCAATKRIRALNKSDAQTIPIIALSADVFPEDIERALESGMNRHIAKPVFPEVLYRALWQSFHRYPLEEPMN